jgi:rhodanese-related sulfurtransferase
MDEIGNFSQRDSVETVTTIELKAMIEDDADFILINVLNVAEHVAAHIPGSYNVPFDDRDFGHTVERLVGNSKRTVIVYDDGPESETSTLAARALENAGLSDVKDFEGGLLEWQSLGYRVEAG